MRSCRRNIIRNPLKVGVIGCGFVAQHHHLPALDALPETSVAALADLDESALSRAGVGRGTRLYVDPMELIADNNVDAVAVCTPPASHCGLALAALEATKPVLVEKPIALTLGECDHLIACAHATGTAIAVCFPYRWHRLVRRARAIVRAGRLGPVNLVQTSFTNAAHRWPTRRDAWVRDPQAGGGVLMELGVHHFDLWGFLLDGEVEQIRASVSCNLAAAAVTGRGPGRSIVSGVFANAVGDNHALVVCGRDATLHVRMDRYDGLEVVAAGRLPGDPALRLARGERLTRQLAGALASRRVGGDLPGAFRGRWRDFAAAVRSGRAPEAGLEDGRRALAAALAASTTVAGCEGEDCEVLAEAGRRNI